ncbi:MAG: hypothetical protein JOZ05_16035 [Acetobacteraceae bacterium]|nr:hypothetical protein [Acetobacteraceae bacterium]
MTNAKGGSITGAKFGAFLEGGFSQLANYGAISGGSYDGVVLGLGGTVTNAAGATITGASNGVYGKYRAAVTVTNSGTISTTTSGAGVDLADGGSFTNNAGASVSGADHGVFIIQAANSPATPATGTVTNWGKVSGGRYHGIHLGVNGTVTNEAGASVSGGSAGIYVGKAAVGAAVTNMGTVTATAAAGAGADLENGGTLDNKAGASFSGGGFGVFVTGAAGTVTNSGTMSGAHGVGLQAGGSLVNNANATIQGQAAGVFAQGAPTAVTTSGSITATASGAAGADVEGGGTITNNAGATLSGTSFGVFLSGGGTVVNAGTIGGASYAVKFSGSGTNNRLVVQPGAVFNGAAGGASGGSNTLEFAGGSGTLSGVSGGSGSVTQGGQSWSFFGGFGTVQVDAGGNWTFSGTDSVATVLNNGTTTINGSLDVTSAIDPASSGLFQIGTGSTLETAAATGAGAQIGFIGNGTLTIDNFAAFGTNPGSSSYTGPLLESFASGDSIDLKNFSASGLSAPVLDPSSGRLQLSNGVGQAATLLFQVSSLGTGTLQAVSDGGSGTRVSLA